MLPRLSVAVIASLCFLVSGCDRSKESESANRSTPAAGPADATRADNTDRNKVDRDTQAKTPMDQSNSSEDVKLTAEIRRAILDDKAMSVNAQNCKIITDKSGVVTLRGPVASQAEKDSIEAKAKAIAGVSRVVNDLEVKIN